MTSKGTRTRGRGKGIWGLASLLAGSIVLGLVFAYTGPFITILAIVASFIYGPTILLRRLMSKNNGDKVKGWG